MTDSDNKDGITSRVSEMSKEFIGIKRFFIVALFIILMSVSFTTSKNIIQSEEFFSRQMAERGIATILFFESTFFNLFSDFDRPLPQEISPQQIMNATVARDHIEFMTITDNVGTVLVHNDKSLIGTSMEPFNKGSGFDESIIISLHNEDEGGSRWGFAEIKGEKIFVVSRLFLPGAIPEKLTFYMQNSGYFASEAPVIQRPLHAFVGIDPKTLDGMTSKFRRSAFFSYILVILGAFSSFFVILLLQRNFIARVRLRKAERVAKKMSQVVSQLEREIRNKEKRAAIGDLAAGVAHELRNPLSSIKGYATYFGQRFEQESNDKQVADIMVQEVDRLNRVITDLLNVSRPTEIELMPTNLTLLAQNTLTLLQQDANQHNITLEVTGKDVNCPLDPDRFRQVLLNLCLNAIDAMQNGGNLQIKINEDEGFAIIEVIDNGIGIPEHIRSRIFDPYFTTKNHGTGLGLLNVVKIVEAHNGMMEVHSEENKGATFKIYLPKTTTTLTRDTFK